MRDTLTADTVSNRDRAGLGLAARLDRVLDRIKPHLLKLHIFMLAIFIVVLVGPLVAGNAAIGSALFENAAALSRFILWGVWFPLLLLSVVALGRGWCGWLCPMGAASEWTSRIGLHKRLPGWLRWTGLPLASFLLVSVLNEAYGLDDAPASTALLFGSLFLAALVFGFCFGRGKRAWCRHACPIGTILGVSARLSAISLQPKRPASGSEGYSETNICPTNIDLKRKTESQHCVACLRCLAPGAEGGLGVVFRHPCYEIAAVATNHPSLNEVLFLFSSIGMSLAVQYRDAVEGRVPTYGMAPGAVATAVFLVLGTAGVVGFLSAVTAGAALFLSRGNPEKSWHTGFFRIGYAFAPPALVALLFCMGAEAFESLRKLGTPANGILAIKGVILTGALLWSVSIYRACAEPKQIEVI
jgi:hypothetical protein